MLTQLWLVRYPTQRMNASIRKTKKDFSLGVQPAADDSGVGLGTLRTWRPALKHHTLQGLTAC